MPFKVDQNTSDDNAVGGKYIQPQWPFPSDIYLKDIKYAPAEGNAGEALYIEVTDSQGRVLNEKFFNPEDDDYDPAKRHRHFQGIVSNLIKTFFGEEALNTPIEASTFQEFCTTLSQRFYQNWDQVKQVPIRLKVLRNNKDYSTIPKYPKIMEPARIPQEDSGLKLSTDKNREGERFERIEPKQADLEDSGDDELPGSMDPTQQNKGDGSGMFS